MRYTKSFVDCEMISRGGFFKRKRLLSKIYAQ